MEDKKRKEQPSVDDTTEQHGKLTWHTRKRKRTPTEDGNKDNSENGHKEANNTRTQAVGKEEDRPKRKKPKTKRMRYQQISDSSDSSDTDNNNSNDTRYSQARDQPIEDRKGIG